MKKNCKKFVSELYLCNDISFVWPERTVYNKHVFSARYTLGTSVFDIFINLDAKRRTIVMDTEDYKEVMHVNAVNKDEQGINLGSYAGVWIQK